MALAALLVPALAVAPTVYAVDSIGQICNVADPKNKPAVCNDNSKNSTDNPLFGPNGVLTTVINILSLIAGVISVFVILIGGIKMITSSGDPNSVASARQTVLYAVIALAIVGAAQAGVYFLLSKL